MRDMYRVYEHMSYKIDSHTSQQHVRNRSGVALLFLVCNLPTDKCV